MAERVREVVAVMDDVPALEMAVDELKAAGFGQDAISLLAAGEAVEAKLGHRYERVEEMADDPEAPRAAFVSTRTVNQREDWVLGSLTTLPALLAAGTVVASTGAVAAAIAGSAAVGVAIATVFTRWMDKGHADWLQEQLDRGGILLWVRTPTPEREADAIGILRRHAAHDVHAHDVPV
ncbi:MAG: hypothetical protein KDG89_06090 [Geminicoccaceae bacterium]|nr:hypothetical protein [Geminicoccaceae bacterium]